MTPIRPTAPERASARSADPGQDDGRDRQGPHGLDGLIATYAPTAADRAALAIFWDGPDSLPSIRAWAALGPLAAAYRLSCLGATPAMVRLWALPSHIDLGAVAALATHAHRTAHLPLADLGLWWRAGALSSGPPYVTPAVLAPWRAVGVQRIGLRRAALAAAAGLTPDEAINQVEQGTFDPITLRVLAALRA